MLIRARARVWYREARHRKPRAALRTSPFKSARDPEGGARGREKAAAQYASARARLLFL